MLLPFGWDSQKQSGGGGGGGEGGGGLILSIPCQPDIQTDFKGKGSCPCWMTGDMTNELWLCSSFFIMHLIIRFRHIFTNYFTKPFLNVWGYDKWIVTAFCSSFFIMHLIIRFRHIFTNYFEDSVVSVEFGFSTFLLIFRKMPWPIMITRIVRMFCGARASFMEGLSSPQKIKETVIEKCKRNHFVIRCIL